MPIGSNIGRLLKERNERIRAFSRNAGISYTTAFDLYHGRTGSISFELLDKLCGYFAATPNDLFPYQGQDRVATPPTTTGSGVIKTEAEAKVGNRGRGRGKISVEVSPAPLILTPVISQMPPPLEKP